MKLITFVFVVLVLALFAIGGCEKSSKSEGGDKKGTSGGDGKDYCAAFQKKGEKVCNDPDVKKYGADIVKGCLKPYMETVKAGDQSKCKALL
jgi:hypothetical protein